MSGGALEVRSCTADDAALHGALAALPGARDAPFPRTAADWDWAFRASPGGARVAIAWRGERPVALAAALGVRTRLLGEARSFACLLDGRLAPGEDDATLAAAFAELRATHLRPEGDLVHYGWPGERDARLLASELGFELLRVQCGLARPTGPGPRALPAVVAERAAFGAEADVLYACCATHWEASAVRDAAWLNWRFAANPLHGYRLLAVQSGEVLRGYGVYRAGLAPGEATGLLVDWLVLPGDDEAAGALLEGALAVARECGASALATALPEWSPWSRWFQERGFRHAPTEHLQLVRSAAPRHDMLMLRDAWWGTPADALWL